MTKYNSLTLPPVPATCPHERLAEVESARTAARLDLITYEEDARVALASRLAADNSVHVYENLLLEVSGQGTLEI